MKISTPQYLPTLLKLILSAACLWYALTKPNWAQILQAWKRIDPAWIMLAMGVYTSSKILASIRLNVNFRLIDLTLTETVNLRLYWLGMLYNLLLPGAITGDAYKVMILGKNPGTSRRALAMAVLLDRFSGLLSLLLFISLLAFTLLPYSFITTSLLIGSLLLIPSSYFAIRWLLPKQAGGFGKTYWLGASVQALVLLTVYLLLLSIGINTHTGKYLLVFLTAAALSVLPISVGGGLGIREFASIQGAQWMGLPIEETLLLSLLFYGVTVLTALPGSIYIFRSPLPESK